MHGNWDAFAAVLRHVKRSSFDATLVLGDLVGYGAGPNQVVEAVREMEGNGVVYTVRGNHDKVVAELEDGSNFNQPALLAARWTTDRLTPANLRFVRELPKGPIQISDELQICHGSPLDEDTYVFSIYDAYEIFTNHDAKVIFFGHTHIPSLFVLHSKGIEVAVVQDDSFTLTLEDDKRYLLNPGSIGQPRDRDPRAAYFTYDSETRTIRWQRVEYAVERAQERITRSGLPKVLADRLSLGI